ncbi:hypothetical protein J1614_007098 [Plenodomus biglobosus]|nr:hypothetical protein J1614_007098 [Plenodomus biglobosus]
MANAKQQENMLLTEHFTWPPISLIDDIINAVNEVLYRCTDSFETGLLTADPTLLGFADRYAAEHRVPSKDSDGQNVYPEAKLEIEEGVLKLETLMENAVDKNFDKLEIWTLRNVLCLPRGEEELGLWVRLGGYENLEYPPKDPSLTPEALYTLRRKLIETQKLNAALVAEKTRNEAQITRLRALLQPASSSSSAVEKREPTISVSTSPPSANANANDTTNPTSTITSPPPFAFLTHTPTAQTLGIPALPHPTTTTPTTTPETRSPLTTHTTFTTSQLPHLRHLLSTLRPHLSPQNTHQNSTHNHNHSHNTSNHSNHDPDPDRNRSIYIETRTRRILEKRGVDTRDGVEGVWDTRRVGGEEVRGLEGLVGAGLGGGDADADADGDGRGDDRGDGDGDVDMDMEMEMEGDDARAGAVAGEEVMDTS